MADIDLASLTAPIVDDGPCGPDLDAEDDDAYATFMSASAMALPEQYFVEDHEGNRKPFYTDDRFKDISLPTYVQTTAKFLTRTHDLRLLCFLSKLQIFDRKLGGFEVAVMAIADLLEKYWDELHPRPESDLRTDVLERLNEQYTVVTALNNAPLFRSRRFNVVTWQGYLATVREASGGREDADTSSVDKILIKECETDLGPIQDVQAIVARLEQSLSRISLVCADKLPGGPPNLKRLSDAVGKIGAMLARINPSAISPGDAALDETEGSAGGGEARASTNQQLFDTTLAAEHALAAATRYLATSEPSSPTLLLLRQAQALVGKSFLEAMTTLLPDHVQSATLSVAPSPIFNLPLRLLAEKGLAREDASTIEDDDEGEADETSPISPRFEVGSRAEALALLDRVSAHYRAVEPSSPIPLLIERSRDLVGKDFMSLIRTMLSEAVLRGD